MQFIHGLYLVYFNGARKVLKIKKAGKAKAQPLPVKNYSDSQMSLNSVTRLCRLTVTIGLDLDLHTPRHTFLVTFWRA
jgi:hypothetical protein